MIRPTILLYSVLKITVIVVSATDVYYQIAIGMIFFEVSSHCLDGISVSFFNQVGSRKSHSYHFLSYVGEIEL